MRWKMKNLLIPLIIVVMIVFALFALGSTFLVVPEKPASVVITKWVPVEVKEGHGEVQACIDAGWSEHEVYELGLAERIREYPENKWLRDGNILQPDMKLWVPEAPTNLPSR